jgi:transcriptional regulator with XRE-family HTH domain
MAVSGSRFCGHCGKPLSRYTSGDVCGPCLVADRSHPERTGRVVVPLEFWFQPGVRAALAQWRWDAVLDAIYRSTGAAQAQLALTAGVSQAQISRLMHAKSKTPTIQTVLGIVDGFGIPRLLAGLAPKALDDLIRPVPSVGKGEGQPGGRVRRRTFGKAVLVTLLTSMTGSPEPVDITQVEPDEVVADLYALDDRYGGGSLADLAERRLISITSQLRDASLPEQAETRVQRIVGELNACAGWLAHDAGQPDRARSFYKEGLYCAHLANSQDLRLHVLASMSMLANEAGKPSEALHLAQGALGAARGTDPRLRSLLNMRVARAAAEQGDVRLLNQSRKAAWRLLDQADVGAAQPSWFRFFDEQEVTGLEGICSSRTGHHAHAATAFQRVLDPAGSFPRNRAVYSARLAESLVRAGQVDEAVGVVHAGLPLFTQIRSTGVMDNLVGVDVALRRYMDVSTVRDCHEILAGFLGR